MVRYLLCALLCLVASCATTSREGFPVPRNYSLNSVQEYKNLETKVLETIDWLETNPLDHGLRKEANRFLLAWTAGAPNVMIKIRSYSINYYENNTDLLLLFMGGWTRYTLQHNDDKTELPGALAGLRCAMRYYSSHPEWVKKMSKLSS